MLQNTNAIKPPENTIIVITKRKMEMHKLKYYCSCRMYFKGDYKTFILSCR